MGPMQHLGTIVVDGEEVALVATRYADGTLGVVVQSLDGSPNGVLSVNPGQPLPDGCIAVKTWGENIHLWQVAATSGLFMLTGTQLRFGNGVIAPVWRVFDVAV